MIAIVSALALVAIFHLARLAEHPVSDNAVDGKYENLSCWYWLWFWPEVEVVKEKERRNGTGI